MPSDRSARRFLFVLLVASLLVVGYVAWPIATALLIAAVLAVVLAPVQARLSRSLGARRALSAGILVVAVLFLLVGPLLGFATVLVKEATDGVRFIQDTVRSEGVAGLVEKLPAPLDAYARDALDSVGDLGQLAQKHAIEQGPRAASAVAAALKATTVATAAVQAAAAGIGYVIAGVPHPLFFTALTFFVALIPAIGAAGVCLFAALIQVATGHPYMGLFLALWGTGVVGLVDNRSSPSSSGATWRWAARWCSSLSSAASARSEW